MRIINAHAHLMKKAVCGLRKGDYSDLVKDMNESGTDKAVVISSCGHGLNSNYSSGDYSLSELFELSKKGRIAVTYFLEIKKTKLPSELKKLEFYLKNGLARGIKIELGYNEIMPYDKKLNPFYDICEKYHCPVIFHTGDTFGNDAKLVYTHPLNIDFVAVDRPNLKIIIAHAGNPWTIDAAEVVHKNPNVYADISGLFIHADYGNSSFNDKRYVELTRRKLNDFIAYARGDKLLFGTDFPIIDSKSYIKFSKSLNLTRKEKELFFHGNAEKLFKIK